MPTSGFTETINGSDLDILNTYVTKEYVAQWYPQLSNAIKAPSLQMAGDGQSGRMGNNTSPTAQSNYGITSAGGLNWKSISVGQLHCAAIKTDGTIWAWGYNADGELGNSTTLDRSSPVISGGSTTNWSSVACGIFHTIAIKTDGSMWGWGYNGNGATGTASGGAAPTAVLGGGTNWKTVTCGDSHNVALKTDGTIWSWGSNSNGSSGNNIATSVPTQIGTSSTWISIASGVDFSFGILSTGQVFSWGINSYGQLGNNSTTQRGTPTATLNFNIRQLGVDYRSIACGSYHSVGIRTDGTLWTWGLNQSYQLGTGDSNNKLVDTQIIGGGTNWQSAAAASTTTHAIKTDGTLWAWGANTNGQMGSSAIAVSSTPVLIPTQVGSAAKVLSAKGLVSGVITDALGY